MSSIVSKNQIIFADYCKENGVTLDPKEKSPLPKLPVKFIFSILSELPLEDILGLRKTCRGFKVLTDDPQVLLIVANKLGLDICAYSSDESLKEIINDKFHIYSYLRNPKSTHVVVKPPIFFTALSEAINLLSTSTRKAWLFLRQ